MDSLERGQALLDRLAHPETVESPRLNGHDAAPDLNGADAGDWTQDGPEDAPEPPRSGYLPSGVRMPQLHAQSPHSPAEWPEPVDFWGGGATLPPWQPEYSPPAIAGYIADQADMRGLDPTMQAACCLAACSFLLQRGIYLDLAPGSGPDSMGWPCLPLLWVAIRGEPGDGKGPAMDAAVYRPSKIGDRMIAEDLARWNEYITQAAIHEKRMQAYIAEAAKNPGAQRPEPPEKPPRRRLFADDTTKEAIAKILIENPRGTIALIKGELASWFGSFGAYGASGSEKDRGDWLEAKEGKRRFIDRVKDGSSWDVPEWRVGILGGIQPSTLAKIADRQGDDGMLQRFEIICSMPKAMKRPRADDPNVTAQWNRVCENLARMEPRGNAVHLSQGAAEFFWGCQEWIDQARQGAPVDPLKFALNKWESELGRLMIVSHCIESAALGHEFPAPEVSLATAQQCFRWMQKILWPHAHHFYTAGVETGMGKHMQKFADYLLARPELTEIKTSDFSAKFTYYKRFDSIQQRREFWDAARVNGWIRPKGAATNRAGTLAAVFEVNTHIHDGRFGAQAAKAAAIVAQYRETRPESFDRTREAGDD